MGDPEKQHPVELIDVAVYKAGYRQAIADAAAIVDEFQADSIHSLDWPMKAAIAIRALMDTDKPPQTPGDTET